MRSLIMFFVSLILGLIVGVLAGALGGLGLAAWIATELKKEEDKKPGTVHYHGMSSPGAGKPEVEDEPTPAA